MVAPRMVETADTAGLLDAAAADPRVELDRLLVRVADGDRGAFDGLYQLLESRVFGLCLALLRERSLAEEVTQETFLHVWQRAGSFDADRGPAVAWILRLTRSKAIDRIRQTQAGRVRDTQYLQAARMPDTDVVVEQVLADVAGVAVQRALLRLPDKQRQALLLMYFGALTSSQISIRIGVPASTVKTRIRDGLAKLGRHLADMDVIALPAV